MEQRRYEDVPTLKAYLFTPGFPNLLLGLISTKLAYIET